MPHRPASSPTGHRPLIPSTPGLLPLLALASLVMAPVGAAGQQAGTRGSDPEAAPVVLITGSTDGLGREVALRMAARGAHVLIHGRNAERGEAVVEEIRRSGRGSARFYRADLASLEETRGLPLRSSGTTSGWTCW